MHRHQWSIWNNCINTSLSSLSGDFRSIEKFQYFRHVKLLSEVSGENGDDTPNLSRESSQSSFLRRSETTNMLIGSQWQCRPDLT